MDKEQLWIDMVKKNFNSIKKNMKKKREQLQCHVEMIIIQGIYTLKIGRNE